MRIQILGGFFGIIALALTAATPVQALNIIPGSSRLDVARGCNTSTCVLGPPFSLFELDTKLPVTGTFDLSTTSLAFNIDLATATLSGLDGGVSAVVFSNVNYSGTVSVVQRVSQPHLFDVVDQLASVSGTLTPIGAGSAAAFALSNVNVTGLCTTAASGPNITCGLTFGAGTNNAFPVNVNGNTRFFSHTVDVTAVPEPGIALLTGIGLSLLAARRTRP